MKISHLITYLILVTFLLSQSCNEQKNESEIIQIEELTDVSDSFSSQINNPYTMFVAIKDLTVYTSYSEKSNAKCKLQILDSIKVIGNNHTTAISLNLWSKIEFFNPNSKKMDTGFVNSFGLSEKCITSTENSEVKYLIYKKNIGDTITNYCEVYLVEVKNKEIVSKIFIDSIDLNQGLELISKKVDWIDKKNREIVFIASISEACGVPYIEKSFIRCKDKLVSLFTSRGISDAGVFHNSDDIYQLIDNQYFLLSYENEPQALDSISNSLKPYLDSPQYFISHKYETEVVYDEKTNEEKLDNNGDPLIEYKLNQYTVYSWNDKTGKKIIRQINALLDN